MEQMRQTISKFFTTAEEMYKFISENNIHIIEENLGEHVAGYLNNTFGEKLIHVNSTIPSYYKQFVIAYFLPINANKCAKDSNLCFLTMQKILTLKDFPLFENILELAI